MVRHAALRRGGPRPVRSNRRGRRWSGGTVTVRAASPTWHSGPAPPGSTVHTAMSIGRARQCRELSAAVTVVDGDRAWHASCKSGPVVQASEASIPASNRRVPAAWRHTATGPDLPISVHVCHGSPGGPPWHTCVGRRQARDRYAAPGEGRNTVLRFWAGGGASSPHPSWQVHVCSGSVCRSGVPVSRRADAGAPRSHRTAPCNGPLATAPCNGDGLTARSGTPVALEPPERTGVTACCAPPPARASRSCAQAPHGASRRADVPTRCGCTVALRRSCATTTCQRRTEGRCLSRARTRRSCAPAIENGAIRPILHGGHFTE